MYNRLKAALLLVVALLSFVLVGCQKQEATDTTGTQQTQPQSGN